MSCSTFRRLRPRECWPSVSCIVGPVVLTHTCLCWPRYDSVSAPPSSCLLPVSADSLRAFALSVRSLPLSRSLSSISADYIPPPNACSHPGGGLAVVLYVVTRTLLDSGRRWCCGSPVRARSRTRSLRERSTSTTTREPLALCARVRLPLCL